MSDITFINGTNSVEILDITNHLDKKSFLFELSNNLENLNLTNTMYWLNLPLIKNRTNQFQHHFNNT